MVRQVMIFNEWNNTEKKFTNRHFIVDFYFSNIFDSVPDRLSYF